MLCLQDFWWMSSTFCGGGLQDVWWVSGRCLGPLRWTPPSLLPSPFRLPKTALSLDGPTRDPPSAGPPKIFAAGVSHDSPRANVHISGPQGFKHHHNSTRIPPEREERMKFPAGESKKSAKFWAVHPSGPPHPSGPHPFGPPPFRARTKKKIGQMRSGKIRSTKIGQTRPNEVGRIWPVNFGQMWYWPNSVWPNAAK